MFDALPDAARVWLFPLDAAPADPDALLAPLADWLPTWQSHGRPVRAQAAVLAGRVLAVAAVISEADLNAGVSGCGIDAMERTVGDALAAQGLGLAPALGVAFRDADGAWQHVPRPAFRRMVKAGDASADTVVLDVTAATVGDVRAHGVERPAGETWAAQAFAL